MSAFHQVAVARDYDELQAALREFADKLEISRDEIDRIAGLPDRFSSKALAPVPIGTCRLGAKTLGPMLGALGLVLIVAKADKGLYRIARSAAKRRKDRVHARLLSADVFIAAKAKLASENGKKGAKGYAEKVPLWKRRANARKGARITNRKRRLKKQAGYVAGASVTPSHVVHASSRRRTAQGDRAPIQAQEA